MITKLMVLALWIVAACSTQAQPYLKQVITFSLTGYKAPETHITNGLTLSYKPQAFKVNDKMLCQLIAEDNHITLKSPQLVSLYSGMQYLGLYVMDKGRVVASATNYLSQSGGTPVKSGAATVVRSTRMINMALTLYSYDTFRMGSILVTGVNKVSSRASASFDNPEAITMSGFSFSAPVAGMFTNSTSGIYGVVSGTVGASSAIVKGAIPGL